MVQKSAESARKRGRPRAYDPETALGQAMVAFWDAGYAATSLDDLGAATGMNRPSLYGAFGDKRALYLAALDRYRAAGRAALERALAGRSLRDGLAAVYTTALNLYLAGEEGARGCFMIGTAATEAVRDPEIRAGLAAGLAELDRGFAARIAKAHASGELPAGADPVALAHLAGAVLHTLAIRARAGAPRAALEAIAAAGVDMICGSPPAPSRRRRRAAA